MPYVLKSRRVELELTRHAETPGELNFLVSTDMLDYLDRHGLSYDTMNDIVGAVVNALDEFKRRVINEYEDKKIATNGDLAQFAYWKDHMSDAGL